MHPLSGKLPGARAEEFSTAPRTLLSDFRMRGRLRVARAVCAAFYLDPLSDFRLRGRLRAVRGVCAAYYLDPLSDFRMR